MQERDQDLITEDKMEKAGYFNWRDENIGDLKEEFLEKHSDELEQYVQEAFEGYCDAKDTDISNSQKPL